MTPFFFGFSRMRLFGVYSPPLGGDGRHGVVVCYPVGSEYYAAYSACRSLSERMAGTGQHVLRFDYPGTGDSGGELEEFGIEDWVESIGHAIDELRAMADIERLTLVGLRHGALLAAAASARRDDVGRLVMWDPSASPQAPGISPRDLDRWVSGLHSSPWIGVPDTLVVTSVGTPEENAVYVDLVRAAGSRCSLEWAPGPRVWEPDEDWGPSKLPVDAFVTMTRWIAA